MSITLIPNKGKSPNYNISGWDMCAFVNLIGNAPVYFAIGSFAISGFGDDFRNHPHIPESATKEQSAKWANNIKHCLLMHDDKITTEALTELKKLCQHLTERKTDEEFKEFISEWVAFLENCEGYEIL